ATGINLSSRGSVRACMTPVRATGIVARVLPHGSRRRRVVFAIAIYVICLTVYAVVAGPERLTEHTPYNHYALLADAWLHGRQNLAGGPPPYAMNNDFAEYHGKTYISFPPFPAVLMLPLVKLAGSPENFRDGQFIIWLAGLAPAFLWLVLEKLRRSGRSTRSEGEDAILSLLFAFGSVYFFTAVEGTVWFAALVVGAALSALYALFALDAESPALAGICLGCAYLTRPSVLLLAPLFALEAFRVSLDPTGLEGAASRTRCARPRALFRLLRWRSLTRRYAAFAAPIVVAFMVVAWMNFARYGRASPLYFDHEFLTVGWHARIVRWGLFGYHYLAKNLGVSLTCLPWLPAHGEAAQLGAPFKINEHGLALWFTTPLYLWLLWPKRFDAQPDRKWLYAILALSAALPMALDLLYQNPGWRQFGYRFSNDYSVLLFVMLAVGGRPMRGSFALAAAWAVAWNAFGAVTFDKAAFDRFYFRDPSQTIVYQPD
ncbi:MAG: hypothetical protein ACREJ3_10170, partial [Polyangiaceae bacterium]